MSRILITGAGGMLAHDLLRTFTEHDVTAHARQSLDITDRESVLDACADHDVIINAAAYTAVDAAETDEDAANRINALGAEHLAHAAKRHGAKLVQVSTDYVFDGTATQPYAEETAHCPISAYGRTKAAGEQAVRSIHPNGSYVVRTAWLYGVHGANFAQTMLNLSAKMPSINVVADQHGQPTWTFDLAQQIAALINRDAPAGIYHGTSAGQTTWHGFAREVFRLAGLDPERIQATDSSSFVRPAPRPGYSVLGHDAWLRAGISPIRPWDEALAAAFAAGTFTAPHQEP